MITRTAVVGAGGMARKHHLPLMIGLRQDCAQAASH